MSSFSFFSPSNGDGGGVSLYVNGDGGKQKQRLLTWTEIAVDDGQENKKNSCRQKQWLLRCTKTVDRKTETVVMHKDDGDSEQKNSSDYERR